MKTVEEWKALLRINLRQALGARQRHLIAVLRETLAAIENAEAPPATATLANTNSAIAGSVSGLGAGEVPRLILTSKTVVELLAREINERTEAVGEYPKLGRSEEAAFLTSQVTVLSALLAKESLTENSTSKTATSEFVA
jgi:uncharacterized protein YqeY